MICREFFVVIYDNDIQCIKSIEARCDSLDNAKLFMDENAYIIKDLNRPHTYSKYEFRVNEVVIIKEEQ